MPRFPKRTVAVAVNHLSQDDDDDDICPVCDGDCTCNNRPRHLSPDVGNGNARYVTTPTTSSVSVAHALGAQPLKIKLTVPPSIQSKARSLPSAQRKARIDNSPAASNEATSSNSVSSHPTSTPSIAGHGQHNLSGSAGPKRKGRPSKAVTVARAGKTNVASGQKNRGNEVNTQPQSQSHLSSHTYARRAVTSRATRTSAETSKSNLAAARQTPKSQAKGTIAKRSAFAEEQDYLSDLTDSDHQPNTIHDDDVSSGRFPTFVSADGLTSEASDSSDSDSDSDASGFGSDSSLAEEEEKYIVAEQRRYDKARFRRELLGDDVPKLKDSNNNWVIPPRKKSVGLSDVDMEGDSVTEEEDEDEEEQEMEDEEDETDGQEPRGYAALVTGWSDDEESSFDADLFFANLTDSSSDDCSSDGDGSHLHESATDPLANSVTNLQDVDFEVTEAWDGQVVFTNGSNNGHGALDLAFEANAAQLLASDSTPISQDSDVEMRASDGDDFDDGNSELGESDGNTTEEELVDEQGLPTSRAMRLFRWPASVSSIDPMSTVSPNVSPAPFSRRRSHSMLESPRPADILAGKIFWEETDHSQHDSAEGTAGESPRPVVRGGVPIMGQFSLEGNVSQKTAILDGGNKDVPSPYPRLGRGRRRFSSGGGSFSSMDLRGRTARLSILPSLPPPSDELSSEAPLDIELGEPIKLDDVLDSTFLDSEPELEMSTIPDGEGEQKLAHNLSRWDRVPVDAFRLTREPASDVPPSPAAKSSGPETRSYGNVLKSSPLHTMLWNDRSGVKEKPRKIRGVIVSPVLLPVRDGDRTPTHVPYHHDLHSNPRPQQNIPFKNRKESRREMRMLKRKTHAPNHQHFDHHQRHQRRNHHPNMKSRGNASVQRTFFSSPTSTPALNI